MIETTDLRTWLKIHRAVGDGAMATWLHHLGVPARTCYEELCVSAPHLVQKVHQQYVAAGADILQTNTFNAHRPGLHRYGISSQMEIINRTAVQLARTAAQQQAYVLGTVGSIVGLQAGLVPWDDDLETALRQEFEDQMRVLLDAGVDGLLIETFADLAELKLAVGVARQLTDLPIVAHLAPESVGVTRDGVELGEAFATLQHLGADVVGLNCHLGLAGILRSYEGIDLRSHGRFSAYPNAGMLQRIEDDVAYTAGPDYFGEMAFALYGAGVWLVGGCCGTTPEHVKAIVKARDRANEELGAFFDGSPKLSQTASTRTAKERSAPVVLQQRLTYSASESTLMDKARQGTTVIVELDPPRTLNTDKFMAGARALKNAGADFITLADNSLGHVRVSNLAIASQLKQEGIEPLVHVTCRDRNLIGQQSHLMGLHVLGIPHILLVTGDPSRFGDLPGSSSVYDTSSMQLTVMVKRLNEGVAFSGERLEQGSNFVVGTSFNPNVRNVDLAYQRLARKIQAGADYVMTQPVFSVSQIRELAERTSQLHVPVFVGIMPLVSARNAKFLHNEVPGIDIPHEILERMSQAPAEAAVEEGIAIAQELIDESLRFFHTIYLITPFLRFSVTAQLVRYIRTHAAAAVSQLGQ